MHAISFDPALPVVATSSFMAGERMIAAGEPVDWRSLGVSEVDLFVWYRAGLVRPVADDELERLAAPSEPVPRKTRAQRKQ